jgi:hypothetical protein
MSVNYLLGGVFDLEYIRVPDTGAQEKQKILRNFREAAIAVVAKYLLRAQLA